MKTTSKRNEPTSFNHYSGTSPTLKNTKETGAQSDIVSQPSREGEVRS